jgi:hypothetical protein
MDGTRVKTHVCLDWTVLEWKSILAHELALDLSNVRLIYAGQPLWTGSNTLSVEKLVKNATVHIIAQMRGDIGVFQTRGMEDQSRLEVSALLNSQPLDASFQQGHVFHRHTCERLCDLVGPHRIDIKPLCVDHQIELTPSRLMECIGRDCFLTLSQLFAVSIDVIKLRRVNCVGKSIRFHTDVSKRTMQVLLNDGFGGNDLVYLQNGKAVIPKRTQGSYTIHNSDIVHGVTALTSGVRFSLFLLHA